MSKILEHIFNKIVHQINFVMYFRNVFHHCSQNSQGVDPILLKLGALSEYFADRIMRFDCLMIELIC